MESRLQPGALLFAGAADFVTAPLPASLEQPLFQNSNELLGGMSFSARRGQEVATLSHSVSVLDHVAVRSPMAATLATQDAVDALAALVNSGDQRVTSPENPPNPCGVQALDRQIGGHILSGSSNDCAIPPDAPGNLSAKVVNSAVIFLRWQYFGAAIREFWIERSVNGREFQVIGSVGYQSNQTNYDYRDQADIEPGTKYFYQIRAVIHESLVSEPSSPISVTTPG